MYHKSNPRNYSEDSTRNTLNKFLIRNFSRKSFKPSNWRGTYLYNRPSDSWLLLSVMMRDGKMTRSSSLTRRKHNSQHFPLTAQQNSLKQLDDIPYKFNLPKIKRSVARPISVPSHLTLSIWKVSQKSKKGFKDRPFSVIICTEFRSWTAELEQIETNFASGIINFDYYDTFHSAPSERS